jgi:hypothetical protein
MFRIGVLLQVQRMRRVAYEQVQEKQGGRTIAGRAHVRGIGEPALCLDRARWHIDHPIAP